MSNRLNQKREAKLLPLRMRYTVDQLNALGLHITQQDAVKLVFFYKNNAITYYPYSGWHTGKGIKDGRGWKNLKKQLL